ncbi:MAG: hypothetical protein IJK02_08455, partial [Clostridia bacterium]|nr:hypothetical protein [Clostridia bacterium]
FGRYSIPRPEGHKRRRCAVLQSGKERSFSENLPFQQIVDFRVGKLSKKVTNMERRLRGVDFL